MPRTNESSAQRKLELLLARSLFRSDKWDPERDAARPFEWDDLRVAYLRKAARLMRTFEKDGLALSEGRPPIN